MLCHDDPLLLVRDEAVARFIIECQSVLVNIVGLELTVVLEVPDQKHMLVCQLLNPDGDEASVVALFDM